MAAAGSLPQDGLVPTSERAWSLRLRRPVPAGTAVGVTVAVLVLTNLANNRWARSWSLPVSLLATGVLLGIMYWAGGGWRDVGLARSSLGRGLRWAAAIIAVVAAGYACAAALPWTSDLFSDQRYSELGAGDVAWRALVDVPFGTVLLEEVAFRGVLYGLLLRIRGPLGATLISSALFGLWHILPSLSSPPRNPRSTRASGARSSARFWSTPGPYCSRPSPAASSASCAAAATACWPRWDCTGPPTPWATSSDSCSASTETPAARCGGAGARCPRRSTRRAAPPPPSRPPALRRSGVRAGAPPRTRRLCRSSSART